MTSKEALEALQELERFVNEDIGIKSHHESGWHLADKPEFHLIKSTLEKDLEVLKIIKDHKLLNYVLKNEKCANMYHLTKEEIDVLKEWLENE